MNIPENSKLNIGAGEDIREDYINIDCRNIKGIDVVSDVWSLDIPENWVSEILISDFLEHFDQVSTVKLMLLFCKWLKKDGILYVRVPDLKAVGYTLAKQPTFLALVDRIYGGQDYSGNFHYWGWTPESFKIFLKMFPLKLINEKYESWNMEFELIKIHQKP